MFLKIILFLIFCVISIKSETDLNVCLQQLGCVKGIEMPGYDGDDSFEAFLGIPYAKPPIGDLRFHDPVPIDAWQGVLAAVAAKSDCLQKGYLFPNWPISGDEDCLYLNIYRPQGSVSKNLPVIFYIHGGGLFSGSANPAIMGPEYFMATKEVLLVIVAYRLGPFGFLSTGDAEMPGNFGLKDQFLALKWVHENIGSFGGNPNEITLFGHSSGASSVHYHMLNAKTKGLFKRAILGSGNALAPFVGIVDKPLEQLHTIALEVGIESAKSLSTKELALKLRSIDAESILNAGNSLKFWFNNNLFNYGPVMEDPSATNAYLIEHPYETIHNGNFEPRPWLTGLVSYRGESAAMALNIYSNQSLRAELNQHFDEFMEQLLDLKSPDLLNRLIDEYMSGIHELNTNTVNGFKELFSDYYFYYPFYTSIKHYFDYANVEQQPVYIYKFIYHGPYSYAAVYTAGSAQTSDVVHFDDLLYQFRQSAIFPDFPKDSYDAALSKDFVNILLEFVKSGQPLHYENVGACTKEQFLKAGETGICNYLEIINSENGYERRVNNEFHVKRMHIWEDIMKY